MNETQQVVISMPPQSRLIKKHTPDSRQTTQKKNALNFKYGSGGSRNNSDINGVFMNSGGGYYTDDNNFFSQTFTKGAGWQNLITQNSSVRSTRRPGSSSSASRKVSSSMNKENLI